jgi:hypothetical protein
MTRLALSAACLEELSQQIAQYGLGPVLDEIRRRCTKPHGRGRMTIDDSDRLAAMGRHLAEDRDLPPGEGALAELARRAVKEGPRPSDLNEDGSVAERAVRRLVRKFDVFCFGLSGRGWDQGKWR